MERDLIHSVFIGGLGYSEPAWSEIERGFFRGTAHEAYIRRSRRVTPDLERLLDTSPVGVENIWIRMDLPGTQAETDEWIRRGRRVKTILTGAMDIEVGDPGADKGEAMLRLARILGIRPEEILALGDNSNDLEMLRLAGIGVAMGNGTQSAAEAADCVTGSNQEDGAAAAIESFCGLQRE